MIIILLSITELNNGVMLELFIQVLSLSLSHFLFCLTTSFVNLSLVHFDILVKRTNNLIKYKEK